MNERSEDQIAEEVLRRTLIEVRAARSRRRTIKGALAVSAVLAVLGIAIYPRHAPVSGMEQPRMVEAAGASGPVADETLAVMVWRDGTPSLEMIGLRDLGSLELQFSLEPVAAFNDDGF